MDRQKSTLKGFKKWKTDIALTNVFADRPPRKTKANTTGLPFWLAYLRAALCFFIIVLVLDLLAFIANGKRAFSARGDSDRAHSSSGDDSNKLKVCKGWRRTSAWRPSFDEAQRFRFSYPK